LPQTLPERFIVSGVSVGELAPDFAVNTHSGGAIRLRDFHGQKVVVLFFYPKDGTAVCTREACAFRDAYEQFLDAGAVVIGVSSDSAASHTTFATQHNLPFHLISDDAGSLRRLYGVPKTLGLLPGRVTYVIDRDGIVRLVFNAPLAASRHVREALGVIRQLAAES
jgi:thioredoxin-dependent peroxiredoxin